jgi:Na+-transporting NADH:ubiquinone oxidoreductase subunit NqrD
MMVMTIMLIICFILTVTSHFSTALNSAFFIILITYISSLGNVWFDYPQVNKVGCFNHQVVHEIQVLGELALIDFINAFDCD